MTQGNSTSRQAGYPDLGRLSYAQSTVFVGTNTDSVAGTPNLHAVNDVLTGTVAVVTRIVANGSGAIAGAGGTAPFYRTAQSPGHAANGIMHLVLDSADTATPAVAQDKMVFFMFDRNELQFGTPIMSCAPDRQLDWRPRHPLVAASNWSLGMRNTSAMSAGMALYGYQVAEQDARAMGFDIGTRISPTAGFKRLVQTGCIPTSGSTTLIAGKAGQCIQILDIHARLQPQTIGSTAAITVAASTTGTIFKFRNDTPANQNEWICSPGIYLPEGESLTVTGDARSANRGSVNVIARFVDEADVPPDHFWGYREPALPSPGGATVATVGKRVSSTITLNYPRLGTTATTPGVGRRHHVEGYAISATKDSTATSDHVWFGLTTGTTGGNIGFGLVSVTTTNNLIAPLVSLSIANQQANITVDQINVPCVANTGIIQVDVMGVAGSLAATPQGEGDIAGWGVTVWGRTLDTTAGTTDNPHFRGGGTL